MSFTENIVSHLVTNHERIFVEGGVPALMEKPRLRVCLFGSYERGAALFRAFTEDPYLRSWFRVTGVVTDDPDRYPSLIKNRVWQYPEAFDKRDLVADLVKTHNALSPSDAPIPVFRDRIKQKGTGAAVAPFDGFLKAANPDVAFMGTFGQLVTQPIIDRFKLGFINFHPTGNPEAWPHVDDAGPAPFEAILERRCKHAYLAMHWVSNEFDAGPLIAVTDPVRVPLQATPTELHERTSQTVQGTLKLLVKAGVEETLRFIRSMPPPVRDAMIKQMSSRPLTHARGARCVASSIYQNMHHIGN